MKKKLFAITFLFSTVMTFASSSLPRLVHILRGKPIARQVEAEKKQENISYLPKLGAPSVQEAPRLEQARIVPLGLLRSAEPIRKAPFGPSIGLINISRSVMGVIIEDHDEPTYLNRVTEGWHNNPYS